MVARIELESSSYQCNPHTLIAVTLTSILKTWPREKPGEKFDITVSTDDPSFCDAMNALISRDQEQLAKNPFRAGKNTLVPLARQLSKFTVRFETVQEEDEVSKLIALRRWMHEEMRDPKETL